MYGERRTGNVNKTLVHVLIEEGRGIEQVAAGLR